MARHDHAEEEVRTVTGSVYGGSMDAGSRTDSFDALLVELVGELDATHPALSDLGRFEVTATLGEGGFGSVYAATDTRDGRQVALKVLRRGSADALLRFKREFRSLADVRHRNLVQLHELLQVGDKWLLSMERVAGEPWDTYVARHPERLKETLAQLVEGVAALHAAGKLHRDLKPSNVLVEDGGRVVILDFGLVRERGTEGSTVLAGTPVYMSPEQCAEGDLGPASDWYAVGVMLYQALSGRVPFEGSMVEMLRAKQEREAPPLEAEGELGELAMRLLAREPGARPSGEALSRKLSASLEEAPSTSRGSDTRELFVGREVELAQLHEALAHVKAGGPRSVYVHGLSGMGKSALVGRFAEQARAEGALVLTGRCYERETVPFKAVDGLVDSLCLHLRKLGRAQAAAVLPRGVHAAAKFFPVLNAVDALSDVPKQREVDDGPEQRRRGFVALKELLGALADGRPLVVIIDDLQWGDEDSARLLAELLGPPGNPPMLFVGAFRREERDDSVLLRELGRTFKADEELGVDALSEEAARRMATMLLGECDSTLTHLGGGDVVSSESASVSVSDSGSASDSELESDVAHRLARESEGHPLFLRQLVEHLGASDAEGPVSLGTVLRARLTALPSAERAVLDVIALASRPLAPALVGAAAGLPEGVAPSDLLDGLRAHGWTRVLGGRDAVECFHDRIREACIAELSDAVREAIQGRLAEALVARDAPSELIAESYLGAGLPTEARPYAVRAGDEATGKLAFEQAARWYREALAMDEYAGDASPLRRKLAEVLESAGRGRDAAEVYLDLAKGDDSLDGLRFRQRASRALLGAGYYRDGLDVLWPLLRELGEPVPTTRVGFLARLAMMVGEVRVRDLSLEQPLPGVLEGREQVRFEALLEGARTLINFDIETSSYLFHAATLYALRARSREGLIASLSSLCALETNPARARKILAELERSQPGDPRSLLMSAYAAPLTALAGGDWPRHEDGSRSLVDRHRDTVLEEDIWDIVKQHRRYGLDRMGELRLAYELDVASFRRAVELRRLFPQLFIHLTTFFRHALARDDVDQARRHVDEVHGRREISEDRFAVLEIGRGACWIELALYIGRVDHARRGVPMLERVRHQIRFVPIFSADYGARLPLVELAFGRGRRSLSKVEAAAKKIGKLPVFFAPAQAAALHAGVAARRKQFAEAARLFDDAVHGFDSAGMKMHAAACRMRQGQILGGDEGHALIAEGEATIRGEGVVKPEQFAQCYAPRFPLR